MLGRDVFQFGNSIVFDVLWRVFRDDFQIMSIGCVNYLEIVVFWDLLKI